MYLRTWSRIYDSLPSIEGIFEGTEQRTPKETDVLYALVSSMAKYASDHRDNLEAIGKSITYADQMPPDFSVVLMQDYMHIEDNYQKRLLTLPEFVTWMRTKGTLLNGV